MEKDHQKLKPLHLCGFGRSANVAGEPEATNRHFVAIDEDVNRLLRNAGATPAFYIHGDASDDDPAARRPGRRPGVSGDRGRFAQPDDRDHGQALKPRVRVVARCQG